METQFYIKNQNLCDTPIDILKLIFFLSNRQLTLEIMIFHSFFRSNDYKKLSFIISFPDFFSNLPLEI